MSQARAATVQALTAEPKKLPLWVCGLIGAGAALVGLLPWLATGMRLPLQNLWDAETLPDDMPIALLPFSQYSLSHLFGLIVTGSAIAGVIARAVRPRLGRGGLALLFAGTLTIQGGRPFNRRWCLRGGATGPSTTDA